jgi:hypothetical protein
MILSDMNKSWKAPEGYTFQKVTARGAYLMVKYVRRQDVPGWLVEDQIVIYVNDMGREVMRDEGLVSWPVPVAAVVESNPTLVGRWFRIKNGWLIVLHGLQEMIKCLKK